MFAAADSRVRRRIVPAVRDDVPATHHKGRGVAVTGAFVLVALLALAVSLGEPATAHAEIPVIGPVIHTAETIGGAILHPADAVLSALLKILQAIFGGIEAKFISGVITALLATPTFETGHVAELEHTTVALAAGMLSAVLTLSIVRYYLAGLTDSGSGGFEALQGLVRVVGAVGFIILWPGIFHEVSQIPGMFNSALLNSGSVQKNVALLFDAALVVGASAFALSTGVGLIFVILIGFIAAIVFIALLWMKVLLSVMMIFLYVTMPLAAVLWPVPEFAWIAGAAMKALMVGLIVPCVWAILFALSAAVNADILTWTGTHSLIDTVIIRPLAGITLMLLCITIPRFLMKTAMIGPHGGSGGWRVWRTLTFGMIASRTATGAAQTVAGAAAAGNAGAQRAIDSLPSGFQPPSGPGDGSLAGRFVFGDSAYREDSKRERAKRSQSTTGSGDSQRPGSAESQPADETAATGGSSGSDGGSVKDYDLPGVARPETNWAQVDADGYQMFTRSQDERIAPEGVAQAMAALPPETQRAIAAFHQKEPLKLRDMLAHNIDSPSLNAGQRDALMTVGSARGKEVDEGIGQAMRALATQPEPSDTRGAGGSTDGEKPVGEQKPSGGGQAGGAGDETTVASRPQSVDTQAPPEDADSLGTDRQQPASDQSDAGGGAVEGDIGGGVDDLPDFFIA